MGRSPYSAEYSSYSLAGAEGWVREDRPRAQHRSPEPGPKQVATTPIWGEVPRVGWRLERSLKQEGYEGDFNDFANKYQDLDVDEMVALYK